MHVDAFLREVDVKKAAFKKIEKVEEEFLPQYSEKKERYRFLVLFGQSRWGKTQYAMSLYGRKRTVYCDCSNGAVPDLRGHDHLQHKAVIFDEMTCEQILAYKRLIQAPAEPVMLGSSATNQSAYYCWVAQTAFIVTSNTFRQEMEKLQKSDPASYGWIVCNCVPVHIKTFTYERPPQGYPADRIRTLVFSDTEPEGDETSAVRGPNA